MTKKDLMLALQRFPDDTPLSLRIEGRTLPLDHVEMAVDSSPQTVEAKNDGESWQAMLASKLKVTLVGKDVAGAEGKK